MPTSELELAECHVTRVWYHVTRFQVIYVSGACIIHNSRRTAFVSGDCFFANNTNIVRPRRMRV
jgi:hypothetical protein